MKHRNVNWNLPDKLQTWEQVNTALLMDIRDELRRLNTLLHCPNFTDIPQILRAVRKNTTKRRKPKKQAPKLRVVR